MADTSRPTVPSFILDDWEINLHNIYIEILSHGGYLQVCDDMCWNRVWARTPKTKRTNPSPAPLGSGQSVVHIPPENECPLTFATETKLKELYVTYLYPYEFQKRKTLVDS